MESKKKLKIELRPRTRENVRIYFSKAQDPEIGYFLPQKARSVEEALSDYEKSLLPDATSYGKSVYADGAYVGDIWAYCIGAGNPDAMLSFCIFEKALWGNGVATRAAALFTAEICEKFNLKTLGAFTFSDNAGSRRVLESNGFIEVEAFTEDGRESNYYQKDCGLT